jgi:predicted Zn-dependent protease
MRPMKVFSVLMLIGLSAGAAYAQEPSSNGDPYEFLMAKFAANNENFSEALSRIDRVIAHDPKNSVLIYEKAVILLDAGRIEEGEKQLREVVRIYPDFYDAQRILGRVLLDRGKTDPAKMAEALDHMRAAYNLFPADISTGVTLSQLLVADGKLQEAEKVLSVLAEQVPDQKIVNYNYAQVLTKLGRGNESRAYLERVVEADPAFTPAVLQLLDLYRTANEYAKAADLLQPMVEEQPLNLDLQRQQALLYLQASQPGKARQHLEEVLKADPEDSRTRFYLAEALNDLRAFPEAEKLYRVLLEKSPDDPDLLAGFAANQLGQHHLDDAEKAYRRLLALPSIPDNVQALGHTQLALIAYLRPDYPAAVTEAGKVLLFRGQPNLQAINLSIDALQKENKGKEALDLIASLLKDHPQEPLLVARQIELLSKTGDVEAARKIANSLAGGGKKPAMIAAEAFVEAGQYVEASSILQRLAIQLPDDPDVLFELGAVNERAGNKQDAEKVFLRLLEKNPDHAPTMNYLGYMWAEQGVNLDRATKMLQTAVSKEPDNGAYIDSLGWVYFRQGNLELAHKYLLDASRLLPRDPTVQEHLGDVFAREGKYSEALERYRAALSLNPEPKNETGIRTKIAEAEKHTH